MRGEESAELMGKVGFGCEASYSTLGALVYLWEGRCEIAGSWNSLPDRWTHSFRWGDGYVWTCYPAAFPTLKEDGCGCV